jgi:hypothetical protein
MTFELVELRSFIVEHYSLEEFRTLCFDLGVRYDALVGEGIDAKARELILYLWRQGRLIDLLNILEKNHPGPFSQASFSKDPVALEEALSNAYLASTTIDHPVLSQSESSKGRYTLNNRMVQVIISLVIVAVACIAVILVVPEFRQFLGLDPSPSRTPSSTEKVQQLETTPTAEELFSTSVLNERPTEMTIKEDSSIEELSGTATLDIELTASIMDELILTAVQDINIHSGPDIEYDIVDVLLQDETTKLICQTGFSEGRLFWMIECPDDSEAGECWVSGGNEYTQVENGDKVPLCNLVTD